MPNRARFFLGAIRGKSISCLFCLLTASVASADCGPPGSDPTGGRPFFPWLWEEQIKPTARESFSTKQFSILLATSAATITARQYDSDVRVDYGDHTRMPREISRIGDITGSGYPGAVLAIAQLVWDQREGLAMSRALIFTAVSHRTIATIVNRERPNNGPYSFPSGHTSTSFATAGSLAYSYGPWVGVPALMVATFVGASRVADNAHWFSDTVAAAGLGLFWARASHLAGEKSALSNGAKSNSDNMIWGPGLVPGGLTLNFASDF